MLEDATLRRLEELLRQINRGDLALPNFQRDFVWDAKATQDLIVSIAKNYPAGSLLRLSNSVPPMFPYREFEGAPELAEKTPPYLILDGQQRLTSLYQAFYGTGDIRYYINIARLIQGEDFEDSIFHCDAVTNKAKRFDKPEVQKSEKILPLSILGKRGSQGFDDWCNFVRYDKNPQMHNELGVQLAQVERKWIRVILQYQFPVITLGDDTPAEAVCTIFETLNRTGVKLSAFELLRARYFARGIDIRELWAKACDDYPILHVFEVDPYQALQVISLVTRSTPSCKYENVLALQAETVTKVWQTAILGLANGLTLLQTDCGVIQPNCLPYGSMLPPLAAALSRGGMADRVANEEQRRKLARWFWCSVFGRAYDNASESQAARDTRSLVAWLNNSGGPPESVSQFRFDPKILRRTTSRQRALNRAIIALLASRKLLDFYTGERITADSDPDIHHIFPRAYLKKRKISDVLADSVLNQTMIKRDTNRAIGNQPPEEYFPIISLKQPDLYGSIVQSHSLPQNMALISFPEFLSRRQNLIWEVIQQVTGAQDAADDEEETPVT